MQQDLLEGSNLPQIGIRGLCRRREVIGFELLDLAPMLDLSHASALNATLTQVRHACLTGIALRDAAG